VSHKFNSSIQNRDDVSYVKLAGVIDEDNELATLVDRIPRGTAVIDLGEIERINSCGVRDWVNWLSRLEGQGTRLVLVECSPAIVAQINLVNNFTGNGVVKSFFVPYFCPECDEEKVLLVETSEMGPPPHEPPMCRCDECDLVMDFDDMPDSYFAFLSNSRKYSESGVSGAIRDMGPPDHEKGRVRSRVSSPAIAPIQKGHPQLPARPPAPPNRTPSAPSYGAPMGGPGGLPTRPNTPSRPPMMGGPGPGMSPLSPMSNSGPGMSPLGMGQGLPPLGQSLTPPRQSRANPTIYVLVAVLMIAIGVLCYLLLTR
jgi:anti-anti-sigma regulatory factor